MPMLKFVCLFVIFPCRIEPNRCLDKSSFRSMYFSMIEEEHKEPTVYKLIVTGPEETVVGVHMIGVGSDEALQGFGVAVKMGATKRDFDDTVAIHPTSAEGVYCPCCFPVPFF